MNYLAHAFLSGEDPEFLLGNVTADLLKGNFHKSLSEKISAGVLHHRKIDVFTDNHPEFRSCLPILYPQHGKYASVVLDILFDISKLSVTIEVPNVAAKSGEGVVGPTAVTSV